ncbi:putative transposase for insertion sequence element [Methanocella paludicola SANAE]|uniref:Transposase for insertion sequence element n=1 Tax=Methanocella paludicola (strain DSM 17711 / JCM 13418 / NBRC 101707 / SANAE) TaxID=304371 RepID=D1YYN8_METPS|nr:IS256 family transposase [Methanocella paludicola]BAI61560.1 putative transposase for insertion sequence element [Methanocella paludicola SANAE]
MANLLSKEQIRAWLKDNDLKDGASIEKAFIGEIKGVLQEALEAEMTNTLGYSKYDWKNKSTDNMRNGHSKKTVRSQFGEVELDIPRDVNREFEPVIVKKHEKTFSNSLEDMIISLFASGMSTRDIEGQMRRVYGVDVSPEMVTRITDKILPRAKEWQNRVLDSLYPFIFLDGVMFNVRQDGVVIKKTAYVVFAINVEGRREVLGIWIGEAESSKFWMTVLSEMRNRGVEDILIASVDGLSGFEEAIRAVYPRTEIQRCIVHQIRNSTRYVYYKDRKEFCNDMKQIYTAPGEEAGLLALSRFEEKWRGKYHYAVKSWRTNWQCLSTFFKYPPEIRRLIYTTNPIENFNRNIRKITKTKSSFPTDDSLFKILYLIVMDTSEKWTSAIPNWSIILNQLTGYFKERIESYI